MFSLENYKTLADSSEDAIILCNDKEVLQVQTHKQVLSLSNVITNVLTDYISECNICLGLFMSHNVYIPSIILSLLKLKHAFVFLTTKCLHKSLTELKLNWILSLNDTTQIENFNDTHRLKLDNKNTLILWYRNIVIPQDVSYCNIFCVVQTSGTTGESKIIRVPHTCIETNVLALRKLFQINFKDVIFWGTPLTFDPSLIELLFALQTGARLLIVPYNVSINPYCLYEALFNVKKITVLQMVPSVFLRWCESRVKCILSSSELKVLAFGGESFPKCVLDYDRNSRLRVFNIYGISEVSCWATVHEIKDETSSDDVSVGECLDETVLEVRDEEGKVVDCGEGEIFIGSCTRVCCLPNEALDERSLEPIYRETGDIAKINEKGLFLIGRKNKIIKRFGHRINLAKMESQIFKHANLENRCIWSSECKILTFILIKNLDLTLKKKTLDKLRVKLISILPEESFPDFIEILERFPLTSHGKIDEKALEKLYSTPKSDLNYDDTFSHLWCKYFGINIEQLDEIRNYTFFEMGGNSITAIQFIRELEDVAELECPKGIYKKIFTDSLEECLNCLKTLKPTKRGSEKIVNDPTRKKAKFIDRGLEILWSYDLKACVDGSPLVFAKGKSTYIAVGSFSHIFVILNEKGENIYRLVLPEAIESTPTLSPCGNYLLVGCFNGVMYCVDLLKNNIIWEYATSGKIKSSPCYSKDHSKVILASYDKTIHCVSAKSGLPLWTTLLDGSIASNPIYDQTLTKILTATTAGTCFCLCESSGGILWKYNCGGPVFGTPCLSTTKQSVIFPVVQGVLHCLSTNGEKLWTFQADGHIFSSLVFYKDCLVFGCHDKSIYVAKVSFLGCDVVKRINLESEISSTPYVCDIDGQDVVVAACNSGVVYVLDFGTGGVRCCLTLPGEVFSSPFVCSNKIYVGCRDNKIYCMEVSVPK